MTTPASFQPPTSNLQRPAWLLLGSVVLSALVYWFGVTQPYHLFNFYQQPLLDLGSLTQGHPEKLWPLIVEFVILFALYLATWRIVQRTHTRSAWLIVIGGAIVFSAILLFTYPYDAADIFDNIMHGRILGVYGANPFRDVAVQFSSDPIFPCVAWDRTISAYGPGWEIVAGLSARLAGNDLLTNVFIFKLALAGFMA